MNHDDYRFRCEQCNAPRDRDPLVVDGLNFCDDACCVAWLASTAIEYGCGAFLGSVEGGQVAS